jgi:hypothetical protein
MVEGVKVEKLFWEKGGRRRGIGVSGHFKFNKSSWGIVHSY